VRKARNHALMVAGGLIVNHAPCGNWKRIDWDRLLGTARHGYKITGSTQHGIWTRNLS